MKNNNFIIFLAIIIAGLFVFAGLLPQQTTSEEKYKLSVQAVNCEVTITRDNKLLESGDNVFNYGDEITITATADENAEMDSLTVNGNVIVNGGVYVVYNDIIINAKAKTQLATPTATFNAETNEITVEKFDDLENVTIEVFYTDSADEFYWYTFNKYFDSGLSIKTFVFEQDKVSYQATLFVKIKLSCDGYIDSDFLTNVAFIEVNY